MNWILQKCQGRVEFRDFASPAVLWPCSCVTLRCCLFTHPHNLQPSAHKRTTLGHPHGQSTLFRRSRSEELSAKTVNPVIQWNWTHVSVCSCVTKGKFLHSNEFTHGFESLHVREVEDVIFYIALIAIENICVLVPTYTLIQYPAGGFNSEARKWDSKDVATSPRTPGSYGSHRIPAQNPSTLANPHWLQIMRSHGASAEGNGCLSLW